MALLFWLALIGAWSLYEHTWWPIGIAFAVLAVGAICMIADDIADGIDR
jgi:hypothetical protein